MLILGLCMATVQYIRCLLSNLSTMPSSFSYDPRYYLALSGSGNNLLDLIYSKKLLFY